MVRFHSKLRLVLFFTKNVSLQDWERTGSFEREVALYRQLQDQGVQLTFITYGQSDWRYRDRLPGITILCNRWRFPSSLYERLIPYIFMAHLRQSDILKTNQMNGADVALRAARLWHKPLVVRCGYLWSDFVAREQGGDAKVTQNVREIETNVFESATRIIVTTEAMATTIAQRLPATALFTRVIPNYVDTRHFQPKTQATHKFDLAFVGRIAPQKNVTALLEAVASLNVTMLIIGSGKLKQELQQRFAHLEGRIKWLSNVPNPDIPTYLSQAKLFILPSHYEGHPKTLIEAMACGLPVIGANSPGIRKLIRHGETGWLCETDAESIRDAIQELLSQPQLRLKLGQNARTFVMENFALNRVLELELALFREVLEENTDH